MKLYRGSCAVNWLPAGPLSAPWSAHADLFLPTEMKTLQYRSTSGPYILLKRSVDALMGSNTLRLIADPRHDVTASAVNTGIWKTHANQDGGGFCCREMWNIQKTENICQILKPRSPEGWRRFLFPLTQSLAEHHQWACPPASDCGRHCLACFTSTHPSLWIKQDRCCVTEWRCAGDDGLIIHGRAGGKEDEGARCVMCFNLCWWLVWNSGHIFNM